MACIGTYIGGEFRASREISQVSFFSFENLPLLSQNQLLLVKEVLQDNPKIISDKSESIKQFSVWEKIRNKMNIYPITPIDIETQ